MSAINRVKRVETRKIQGFEVEVRAVEHFTYQGVWESDGYEIYLESEKIGHFYGWPTNSDLEKLLKK